MHFTVDWESMGQSKAKSVCALLQELNESVVAKFVEESPEALLKSNPTFFAQFTLVIATQVTVYLSCKCLCSLLDVLLKVVVAWSVSKWFVIQDS